MASLIRFVSDHSSYRVATALVIGVWVTAVAGPSGDMTLQLEVCGEVRTGLAEIDESFPGGGSAPGGPPGQPGCAPGLTGQVHAALPVLFSALVGRRGGRHGIHPTTPRCSASGKRVIGLELARRRARGRAGLRVRRDLAVGGMGLLSE